MGNECHFCHGLVSVHEAGHILLDGHADHQVYLHEQCASGYDLVEESADPADDRVEVTCPECGAVERI